MNSFMLVFHFFIFYFFDIYIYIFVYLYIYICVIYYMEVSLYSAVYTLQYCLYLTIQIKIYSIYFYFLQYSHCLRRVRIRSYSGLYFPSFGLNTEKYIVSLRIQAEYGKIRTTITLNTDTFT